MPIPLLGFPSERLYGGALYECRFDDGRNAFVEEKGGAPGFAVLIYADVGYGGKLIHVENLLQAICLIEHYLGGNSGQT